MHEAGCWLWVQMKWSSPELTVEKTKLVTKVSRVLRRVSRSKARALASMQCVNSCMKYARLCWYMGSMAARSAITKYRMEPRTGTVRYLHATTAPTPAAGNQLLESRALMLLLRVGMWALQCRLIPCSGTLDDAHQSPGTALFASNCS